MCEHKYEVLRSGYFKLTGEDNAFGPTYDQSVAYASLFCVRCADLKEVIAADYRQQPTEGASDAV